MNIVAFNFESSNVRVVLGENGEPMFVAADVLFRRSRGRRFGRAVYLFTDARSHFGARDGLKGPVGFFVLHNHFGSLAGIGCSHSNPSF